MLRNIKKTIQLCRYGSRAKNKNNEVYLIKFVLQRYFERDFIILSNGQVLDPLMFISIKCNHKEAEH